jgi:hypothetical protein
VVSVRSALVVSAVAAIASACVTRVEAGKPAAAPATPLVVGDGALAIAVHVDEPAGVERKDEPVLASVPLPEAARVLAPGELTLEDDRGEPVPCQVRILTRWAGRPEDGTRPARWVLLAFEADLAPHRTRAFKLIRRPASARPSKPVVVDATRIETGVLAARIGGGALLADLRLGSRPVVDALTAYVSEASGREAAGVPEKVEVLEPGPVRGVVRISGHYASGLGWALSVEGWAGRGDLGLSLETRCSNPRVKETRRLEEVGLELRSHDAFEALPPDDGSDWFQAAGGGFGLALRHPARAPSGFLPLKESVHVQFLAPTPEGPERQRFLGDLQHRTDEVLLTLGERAPVAAPYRTPLRGQPDASWIRDTGGFLGPLADETDERTAYAACGLVLAPGGLRAKVKAEDLDLGDVNVKWDTETDDARDLFVAWLRTGERRFLDEACAWAEFLRDRYAPRTDGFTFAESEHRPGGPTPPAAKKLDLSRLKESHVYGEGLVAHYLLTGDRASLEAAIDIGELAQARFGRLEPEAPIVEMRVSARPFELVLALLEVTGDDAWRELATRFAANAFATSVRDRARGCYAFKLYVGDFNLDDVLPRGTNLVASFPGDAARGLFKRGPRTLSLKGERAAFPYQDRELAHALARTFEVTGDERARQALLGLADFYLDEGIVPVFYDKALEVTPYFVAPYLPEPEVARYPQASSPLYSTNLGLIEAAAYLVSRDPRFLEQAKRCLRIAALRGHGDLRPVSPDEKKIRLPTTVQWAHGWDDVRTFQALRKARTRPAAVSDLTARRVAPGTVELGFTAPAGAVRAIVQASASPIGERGRSGTVGVFAAEPLATEAVKAGRMRVTVPARPELRFFVVRGEDEAHGLSPLSNIAELGAD